MPVTMLALVTTRISKMSCGLRKYTIYDWSVLSAQLRKRYSFLLLKPQNIANLNKCSIDRIPPNDDWKSVLAMSITSQLYAGWRGYFYLYMSAPMKIFHALLSNGRARADPPTRAQQASRALLYTYRKYNKGAIFPATHIRATKPAILPR